MRAQSFSHVQPCTMLWTVAHQASLSMRFPRQEYWSGLPFPSGGDHPNPGIKPMFSALAGGFITTEPPGNHVSVTLVGEKKGLCKCESIKILEMGRLSWIIWVGLKFNQVCHIRGKLIALTTEEKKAM